MTDLILHHFDGSAFAEKSRVALGIKGLSWNSVQVPKVMPKPDLMPLTGGYRRTPNMQIGADIYCDNRMIIRALEQHYPEPTLFPGGRQGMPYSLGVWSDTIFFATSATVVFSEIGDQLPESFFEDREKMTGRSLRPKDLAPAIPHAKSQWRVFAGWINDHIKDGKPWIMGDAPGLADINAYMCVKFVRSRAPKVASELLEEFPIVIAWADRMDEIGYGTPTEISSQEALDIAKAASPKAKEEEDPFDPIGLKPGDTITVTPDDSAKDPVAGNLISSSAQHITILRNDDRVGEVAVHFPRVGFKVERA